MNRHIYAAIASLILTICCLGAADAQPNQKPKLMAGVGKSDITPPVGTPLAGYEARHGEPSKGVHDPTEARALIIDSGGQKLALLSVDHLGFDHRMVDRTRAIASRATGIPPHAIFVMSSHTHSGGGAYMRIVPSLGQFLTGRYDPRVRAVYERRAAEAIIAANRDMKAARIAFGSGEVRGISRFRSTWPPDGPVDPEIGVIRVDFAATGKPMAVLMNFAVHPTVLGSENMEFSADFVAYARRGLERLIGGGVMAIFANGAEGTIGPVSLQDVSQWQRAESIGNALAAEAYKVALRLRPRDGVEVEVSHTPLEMKLDVPKQFAQGVTMKRYRTEVAAVSFDDRVALVAIPGEMSSMLGSKIKARGRLLGFDQTFILGVTNDWLGYIVTEDEYRHHTYEASISFFGPAFGSFITNEAFQILEGLRPIEKK